MVEPRPEPYEPHSRDRVHQGDLIANLDVAIEAAELGPGGEAQGNVATRAFAVVLTQECDLEQDHRIRSGNAGASMPDKSLVEILFASVLRLPSRFGLKASSRLPSVLLASALDALTARKLKYGDHPWLPTDAWRRVAQNKDERYQVLEPYADVHPGLLVDFKQVFSVSTDYLYAVLNHSPSTFLCSMAVPYREHLSSRFAYFMSRVALPRDHDDPAPIAPAKLPK